MPNLDVKALRYMSSDEFRVLTAVEMGMKNHELVPTALIEVISGLKRGGAFKYAKLLCRNKLVAHQSKPYDGYRLTFKGYDYLALKTLSKRETLSAVGIQIGVGKESDIFTVSTGNGREVCLKLHRLGRRCFRTVKNNRDYIRQDQHASWLYLSRLSALKEFAFMSALYSKDFPVPTPIDVNRHCVVMSLSMGYQLNSIQELRHPGKVFDALMQLICRLASYGLIHCDFNEFNLLVDDEERVTLIDFPQMISTSHRNAQMYFDRDVDCVRTFFRRRFGFIASEVPDFNRDVSRKHNLDVDLAASGWTSAANADFEELNALAGADDEEEPPRELLEEAWDDEGAGGLQALDHEGPETADPQLADVHHEGDAAPVGLVADEEHIDTDTAGAVPLGEMEANANKLWAAGSDCAVAEVSGMAVEAVFPTCDTWTSSADALVVSASSLAVTEGTSAIDAACDDASEQKSAAAEPDTSTDGPSIREGGQTDGAGDGSARIGAPPTSNEECAVDCDVRSVAPSEHSELASVLESARGCGHSDPLVAERVKRELRRKKTERPGKSTRNEHKDREKRKLAASTKREASGFSGW